MIYGLLTVAEAGLLVVTMKAEWDQVKSNFISENVHDYGFQKRATNH